MESTHPGVRFVPVLGSVTNAARLEGVFRQHQPDLVFHAAAYKQLPLLETNVVEGFWNNVIGTLNTARCAARYGARRFVLISTDKAVRPSSVLGVTKLLAERVVLELPSLRGATTEFRVVRFGNVLGSEGSVVPRFSRQLAEGGPITVTHPEVRRYFMTIPEAVHLVLQASSLPEAAGRIALLDMGTQVRILDLAEQMIHLSGRVPYEDIDIVFTGLRPGEKLEEELVGPGESTTATSLPEIQLVERSADASTDLARRLRQVTALAARCDEPSLIRALASLAPEYEPEHLPLPPIRRVPALAIAGATPRPGHQRASA
jgi:FlaA1/EpsC-like NDP-sugar epimerase